MEKKFSLARTPSKGEYNDGKSRVDVFGYVPRSKRIQDLINAGERLNEIRRQFAYDFSDTNSPPDETAEIPPQRQKGFDLSQVTEIERKGQEALKRIKERFVEKKVEQKAVETQAPPEGSKAE